MNGDHGAMKLTTCTCNSKSRKNITRKDLTSFNATALLRLCAKY